MRTTLSRYFSHPLFHVGSNTLSEAVVILQTLMVSAENYREKGPWGWSGPHEYLCGYGGCVNCHDQVWHSARDGCVTYGQHLERIFLDVLKAVSLAHAHAFPAFVKWREEQGIGWGKVIQRRVVESRRNDEEMAWEKLRALDGARLCAGSLNRCHRGINVGKGLQLCVSRRAVVVSLNVSSRKEYGDRCGSSWSWSGLTGRRYPRWEMTRESFAEFLNRAAEDLVAGSVPRDEAHAAAKPRSEP